VLDEMKKIDDEVDDKMEKKDEIVILGGGERNLNGEMKRLVRKVNKDVNEIKGVEL
jgi:MoaA/NifB/PqqE/SkfB family radical SAM enzyme